MVTARRRLIDAHCSVHSRSTDTPPSAGWRSALIGFRHPGCKMLHPAETHRPACSTHSHHLLYTQPSVSRRVTDICLPDTSTSSLPLRTSWLLTLAPSSGKRLCDEHGVRPSVRLSVLLIDSRLRRLPIDISRRPRAAAASVLHLRPEGRGSNRLASLGFGVRDTLLRLELVL